MPISARQYPVFALFKITTNTKIMTIHTDVIKP